MAFLPDHMDVYTLDREVFPAPHLRSRRNKKHPPASHLPPIITTVVTDEWLSSASILVLLRIDPRQPYSLSVVRRLANVVAEASLIGVVAVVNDDHRDIAHSVLAHSGWAVTTPTSALDAVLHWSHVPFLTVVETQRGRNIAAPHEELALEWNPPEMVAEQWLAGQSALTAAQQWQAALVFASCVVS